MAPNHNLYLAALVACLTAALFGYSVGFIGGVLVLPSFLSHFGLDTLPPEKVAAATSGTVSVWLVGALIGVPLGMPVCSRLGRKTCLFLSAGLYVLGVGVQLVQVPILEVFNVGRFLNGLGVGVGTLVSPMYIAEISTPAKRGMLLSGYQTALQLGALIGFWAAFTAHASLPDSSLLQWQIPIALQFLPGIPLLLGTILVPESPRFLAEQGRVDQADEALAWLRALPVGHVDLQQEIEELQQLSKAAGQTDAKRPSFWSEMRTPSIRKRLMVGIGLMVAQNMVGLNALNYYAPKIFMSAGFTSVSSSLFLTGLFGVIKVISAVSFMFYFVGLRGNRFWLKFGSVVCGASMIVLAVCVHSLESSSETTTTHPSQHPNIVLSSFGSLPVTIRATYDAPSHAPATSSSILGLVSVAMVYIFAFTFGISLGPISWNVCSEIFPAHLKARCCAITTCTQWIFQIVIATITPHLLAKVGWATYVVYAVCCMASFVWVWISVPETQGVALGRAMDELFGSSPSTTGITDDAGMVDETTALLRKNHSVAKRRDSVGLAV